VQTGKGLYPRAHSAWTPLARTLAATGDRWTLMIVIALAPGRMRLTHLRKRLPGVSTGVLERHVQQMVALGLLSRTRFKEMPPRVELELTDAGRELLPIANALARWGMRHLWSPPREREHVDIDALLRLLPALLEEETSLPEGSVEAVVADADPPVRRIYRIDCGCLRMVDRAADGHMTCLHGDGDAWVAALGPSCDYGRLRITGDERLARCVLDALPRSA
jgi:DNA-binding HxlR family transcriptional regulator